MGRTVKEGDKARPMGSARGVEWNEDERTKTVSVPSRGIPSSPAPVRDEERDERVIAENNIKRVRSRTRDQEKEREGGGIRKKRGWGGNKCCPAHV